MKTTIELPDALLDEARAVAERERTTLRDLVAEGLRRVVGERRRGRRFRLREVTFKGNGLQSGVTEGSWEDVRDLAYRGRGA